MKYSLYENSLLIGTFIIFSSTNGMEKPIKILTKREIAERAERKLSKKRIPLPAHNKHQQSVPIVIIPTLISSSRRTSEDPAQSLNQSIKKTENFTSIL